MKTIEERRQNQFDSNLFQDFQVNTFQNARNQSIFYQYWIPTKPIQAVVVFLHGIAEHSSRYDQVFKMFAQFGIAGFALDHHGHGLSEGERVYSENFNHFVDDVNKFTSIAKEIIQKIDSTQKDNIFLWGMSFGALIATYTVFSDEHQWKGVILSAGALGVEMNCILKVQSVFSSIFYATIPKARLVPAVKPADLSRDPQAIKEYVDDPLNVVGNLRVCIGKITLDKMNMLAQLRGKFSIPLLCMHGTADRCTSPQASEEFVNTISSTDREYKAFEGLYHCIFHEPEREDVINYMIQWILKRCGNQQLSSSL